jgi:hypothetical protein
LPSRNPRHAEDNDPQHKPTNQCPAEFEEPTYEENRMDDRAPEEEGIEMPATL